MEFSVHKLVNSIIYVAVVVLIYFVLMRVLKMVFRRAGTRKMSEQRKHKVQTLSQMASSLLKYALLILVVLVVLANFGVNVTSLLAGLGIMAAIFGLACQDIIKDVIAGVTIITENQFSVGDEVAIDDFRGVVSSVGLKTTEITGKNGEVKIISNRNMDGLVNYSKKQ